VALEVGAVYASAGVKVDDTGFNHWRRRIAAARADARDGIDGNARLDVDQTGFRRFHRELDDGERHAHRFSTGVRGSFGVLRGGIAGPLAVGAGAVGLFGVKVVQTASDISESLSKNRVLFGDHA
jgi:hypothetical protein